MGLLGGYQKVELSALRQSYDYIIVGGGTAGCVLASRLSEDTANGASVLLIERGKPSFNWTSRVPLFSSNFQSDGELTYKFYTEPQKQVNNRKMEVVVGNALGGSSRINGMIYTRGLPAQFNAWSMQGQRGWSYDDMLPYFLKSERALDIDTREEFHGVSGLWSNRSHAKRFFPTADRAVKAAEALGFPFISDVNSPRSPIYGIARLHYTIDSNGHRCDAASGFLPAHIARARKQKLHLCFDVIVSSLEFSRDEVGNLCISGVNIETTQNSIKRVLVSAKREVILCAGALGTPQILMLSGIGPKEHLSDLGIEVRKNLLGVGSNFQDHIGVPLLFNVPLNHSIVALQKSPYTAIKEITKYLTSGSGMLLCPVHELSLWTKSSALDQNSRQVVDAANVDGKDPANIPDIELMTIAYGKTAEKDKHLGGYSLWAIPVSPHSRGTVRLRSKDPREPPICDPSLLSDDRDRVIAHIGIQLCLRIKERMVADGYPITDFAVPKSSEPADLDKHIDEWGQSVYHYTSTCRMAPENDDLPGVVDDELRVHGLKGLRIADASVFPNILATHLQATTVAVAERCADLIKQSYRS